MTKIPMLRLEQILKNSLQSKRNRGNHLYLQLIKKIFLRTMEEIRSFWRSNKLQSFNITARRTSN